MELKRWPRKNDPESITARQKALGLTDGVTQIDLSPFVNAQEMLTGAAVIPVSVVGPVELELGEYELEEPFGRVSETGSPQGPGLRAARAHRGRPLRVALSRRTRCRGVRRVPNVRARGPNHQSILLRLQVDGGGGPPRPLPRSARRGDAPLARQRERSRGSRASPGCAKWTRTSIGPMCHVLWAFTTGDACGPNMMTRNAYALNMGYVMENAPVTARARRSGSEHGW